MRRVVVLVAWLCLARAFRHRLIGFVLSLPWIVVVEATRLLAGRRVAPSWSILNHIIHAILLKLPWGSISDIRLAFATLGPLVKLVSRAHGVKAKAISVGPRGHHAAWEGYDFHVASDVAETIDDSERNHDCVLGLGLMRLMNVTAIAAGVSP